MGYFLFIDESGHDRGQAPYEVLAGVAIEDKVLWDLIQRIHDAEHEHFGMRITEGHLELKARKLLKRKTFRLANQLPAFSKPMRMRLAQSCLQKGRSPDPQIRQSVTREELTALGQTKIAFVEELLELCSKYQVKAFASIVDISSPRPPEGDFLRKDYAYLFERFYYFLEDQVGEPMGIVVFDELEKTKCHLLINQMEKYFLATGKGRMRSSRIIPEPFFVHSELTSAIQLADLIAYVISWGVQVGNMPPARRSEMAGLAETVCNLRHRAKREIMGREDFVVWSFALIDDLRPKEESDQA
jgi:hypothetical protein